MAASALSPPDSTAVAAVTPESRPALTRRPRVLLGLSGSVACVKWPALVNSLSEGGAEVAVVPTAAAEHFVGAVSAEYDAAAYAAATARGARWWRDADEWATYRSVRGGDPVLHIELRRWADCLLIAPTSANTLSKLATGGCDNLLTCVARAWDPAKPLVLAPAMNTAMWTHPLTARQLAEVRSFGPHVTVIEPVVKTLACGDVGTGAMADVTAIAAVTLRLALAAVGAEERGAAGGRDAIGGTASAAAISEAGAGAGGGAA